ncbi:MAG: hypothetical protein AVDCRST_MAG30-4151, partial [uncultured Solirubrobacteraceae bacterium]
GCEHRSRAHRPLRLRRRPPRDRRAARGRGLLPLHPLPAPVRGRRARLRACRAGVRADRGGGGPPAGMVGGRRAREGLLRRLRVGDARLGPRDPRRRDRAPGRHRGRSGRAPRGAPVRRLRGAVGDDPRRWAPALRRADPRAL